MPRLSRGSVVQLQAINELIRYVARAPKAAAHPPGYYVRALRGKVEPELPTLRRLFDALFCDLLVIPKPRLQLGDALAERNAEKRKPTHRHTSVWAGG